MTQPFDVSGLRQRRPTNEQHIYALGVDTSSRHLIRHLLASLAYRTQKALREAPESFGDFRVAPGVRTPRELVRHMTSVLGYARTFFVGGTYEATPLPDLAAEVSRFHEMLDSLGGLLSGTDDVAATAEQLLQGPLADAMTHAGQLAMLRRLCGSPVAAENFLKAEISAENLGPNQPMPRAPGRRDGRWDPRGVTEADQ
jgi:hypothetical protein